MRNTMKSISADAIILINLVGQSVQKYVRLHCLMKCRIKDCHAGNEAAHQQPHNIPVDYVDCAGANSHSPRFPARTSSSIYTCFEFLPTMHDSVTDCAILGSTHYSFLGSVKTLRAFEWLHDRLSQRSFLRWSLSFISERCSGFSAR